jgi:mannitol/fructose-specific phosphotransferase system IIA component (Ntr-type)
MNLKKLLPVEHISLNLKSDTKEGIVGEMIDMMVASGKLKDRAAAVKAVIEREQKMSTGMQHGIAIPHGKTDTVDQLVAALAFKKDGMDFGSLDGQPSHIFVMTVSPVHRTGPHIQFLAEMSQLLNDADRRHRLLAAQTPAEVIEILTTQ